VAPTPRDRVRQRITEAAGVADELTNELLEFSDRPQITSADWLRFLASTGKIDARLRRTMSAVSVAAGLPRSAKGRLLEYLKLNMGRSVDKLELAAVAGIFDWARRIRELRVEEGWPIAGSGNRSDLPPGTYVLEANEPSIELRDRWRTANRIRRQGGSGKARILAYLRANLQRAVAQDEIDYVAGVSEKGRRIRELAEGGWQIQSTTDDPQLRPGEYRLASDEQLTARAREAIKTRFTILDRDDRRCVVCGAGAGAGRVLQVHHIQPVMAGGDNEPSNLETLCQFCHAGKHATNATAVRDELVTPEAELPLGG
jgi:5-methylcytosine-specific restriction endonuclease McrA